MFSCLLLDNVKLKLFPAYNLIYYIINSKALAFITAKPFVAPQWDEFNDSMFLNENASFQMPLAFRRRSTAAGLKLLCHKTQ